jgi:hypothetical protein
MNRLWIVNGLLLVASLVVGLELRAEESVQAIPLYEVLTLPPDGQMRSRIDRVFRMIPAGQKPDPGFAVTGKGKDALFEAYKIFLKHQPIQKSLPTGTEISLVFYAPDPPSFLEPLSVERTGNTIEIKYRALYYKYKPGKEPPGEGPSPSSRLVTLIPLGKLPAGKYAVKITRVPYEPADSDKVARPIPPEWEDRIVCQPFSFTIGEQGTPPKNGSSQRVTVR